LMQFFSESMMALFIGSVFLLIILGFINNWPMVPNNITLLSVTMNWVITIPSFVNFFLFSYSMLIQYMGSVERIFYNVDKDITEGDFNAPRTVKSQEFPDKGVIEVNNIKVRYREGLPLVLDGVTFIINENEKVGIIGRTGSGKSSLLLALTRIINVENSKYYNQTQYDQKLGPFKVVNKDKIKRPQPNKDFSTVPNNKHQNNLNGQFYENQKAKFATLDMDQVIVDDNSAGYIKIDEEQIDGFGLNILRRGLCIIPQDTFVFSGSLKFNIDPYTQYTDHKIFDTLKKYRIFESIKTASDTQTESIQNKNIAVDQKKMLENKVYTETEKQELLNFKIEEAGKNLSVGQKQLICIARALIRKPKILLMDEATSNIDQMTDKMIQKIIKEDFNNTTILTIAHRLKTIIEYDRILVLDKGKLVEQGTPIDLINQEGIFHEMISKNGSEFEIIS